MLSEDLADIEWNCYLFRQDRPTALGKKIHMRLDIQKMLKLVLKAASQYFNTELCHETWTLISVWNNMPNEQFMRLLLVSFVINSSFLLLINGQETIDVRHCRSGLCPCCSNYDIYLLVLFSEQRCCNRFLNCSTRTNSLINADTKCTTEHAHEKLLYSYLTLI